MGDSDEDRKQSQQLIGVIRSEIAPLEQELHLQRQMQAQKNSVSVPDETSIERASRNLLSILQAGANTDDVDARLKAHRVIGVVTGGRIELEQMGPKTLHTGFIRGSFQPNVINAALQLHGVAVPSTTARDPAPKQQIDFVRPPEIDPDRDAERLMALLDEQPRLTLREAGRQLGMPRNRAAS